MNEPESSYIPYKLTDVGTRYMHYAELLELWELNYQIMVKYHYDTPHDTALRTKLESAVELLRKQMVTSGHYVQSVETVRSIIEAIPEKPEDIQGGRGTPLRENPTKEE